MAPFLVALGVLLVVAGGGFLISVLADDREDP
jgi:hypothetical protein